MLPIIAMVTFTLQAGAVLSVARTATRLRMAACRMRARTMRSRFRTRITALGSPSGVKYQSNKDKRNERKSEKA